MHISAPSLRTGSALLLSLATIGPSLLQGQTHSTTASLPVARPSALTWVPKETLPPGAVAATAHGDPHVGPYAFYGRFPKNFRVPPHRHSHDVDVVILTGSMTIERDGLPPLTLQPNDYFFLPAHLEYAAACPNGCLFLAWGREPFDIEYVHAEDDPRRSPSHR